VARGLDSQPAMHPAVLLAPLVLHAQLDVDYALNTNFPPQHENFIAGTGSTAKRANEFGLNGAVAYL